MNAVFDAMSTWRTEAVNNSEKNSERVIEKIAAAARALGWPEQIVDTTRTQLQSVTKMQIQTMDHMMDVWEEQIKSPNPSSAMLSKLTSLPDFGPTGSWPNADASRLAALNPLPRRRCWRGPLFIHLALSRPRPVRYRARPSRGPLPLAETRPNARTCIRTEIASRSRLHSICAAPAWDPQ